MRIGHRCCSFCIHVYKPHDKDALVSTQFQHRSLYASATLHVTREDVRGAKITTAILVTLDVCGNLSGRAARTEEGDQTVLATTTWDLEALTGKVAEIPHESEEEEVDHDRDDPKCGISSVRLVIVAIVTLVGVITSLSNLVFNGIDEHIPSEGKYYACGNNHCPVPSHVQAVRDLCKRDACAKGDHETIWHDRRKAVAQTVFPSARRNPEAICVSRHSTGIPRFHSVQSLWLGLLGGWRTLVIRGLLSLRLSSRLFCRG